MNFISDRAPAPKKDKDGELSGQICFYNKPYAKKIPGGLFEVKKEVPPWQSSQPKKPYTP